MNVQLLRIARTTLIVHARRCTIDQLQARYDTNVLTGSQDIEQSGFASAGRTHECCKFARLHIAVDILQQAELTGLNRYVVAQPFPRQYGFGLDLEL